MPYPNEIDKFTEKLNKNADGYAIEEELIISNGVFEGLLSHDNINNDSIQVYTGSKFTGDRIRNFIISIPSEMPWKRIIKVFSDTPKVYATYETTGDQVEAEDINQVQDSLVNTQVEVERYKESNDARVSNDEIKITNVENNKAEKTYVDTELNKRYLKSETYNKTETDQRIQIVIDAAPAALDTLKELADALNNDPNFAATITTQLAGKVDKIQGKQLSTEDYTTADKQKLIGIETGANKYIHPSTHPASMITGLPTSLPASGGNADTVDNYHLDQDVRGSASPTFTGVNVSSFENVKATGNLINKAIANDTTQIAQSPIGPFLWHDIFAFNKVATPSFETSADGSTWGTGALNSNLFSQKENQAICVLDYTTQKAVRWTWHSSGFGWSSGQWLLIAFTYVPVVPNKTIKFESSADGITWTTRHTSSGSWNAQPVWFYVSGYNGDNFLRLTITWNSGNGNVCLSSIRLLTARWGDQGQGRELSFPYDWDANRNIIFSADAKAASFHKSDGTSVSYEGHNHTKSEITDMPTKLSQFENDKSYITQSELGDAGYGDMTKSQYDTNNDGIIDRAKIVVGPITWNNLKGV